MSLKMKSMLLILLMSCAAFAGCLGSDDDEKEESNDSVDDKPAWLDASDAGYTYASNVDNHRSLMNDLCEIKAAASSDGGYDFTGAKEIYMNGKNAEKSDGSFRTLAGFASATGKNHDYDSYYGMNGSVDAHIMAALDGTGDFEGTSDTVRYQGTAKLTVNLGMVAYTLHELNAAILKAEAGNWGTDDAQHAWDEGWAFFHGPDEHYGCSPAKVMEKRASDFGTADADGVAATFAATEAAMNAGLTALQNEDMQGVVDARDEVLKNLVIVYSQAVLKYTSKMDSNTTAEKYQAEGYAFWKTMEAYAAPYMHDGCYNMEVGHKVMMMGEIDASACDAFVWTNGSQDANGTKDTCYNTVNHMVSTDATDEAGCDGYTSMYYQDNYAATLMNNILDLTDATQLGTSYDVTAWLQPVWDHYGITAEEIGSL
mgnify:CR=1 FL=1